jgi:hypothetical protein
MRAVFVFLFLCLSLVLPAQIEPWEKAALSICGAGSIEELDEESWSRFQEWTEHPLSLNTASLFQLRQSGLMSDYQCAVLDDYRRRYGDIWSWTELACLDGFSSLFVEALRMFTYLESDLPLSQSSMSVGRIRHEAVVRTTYKGEGVPGRGADKGTAAAKYRFSWGERVRAAIGGNGSWGEGSKGVFSAPRFYVAYSGKRYLEQLVVGDFNARFSQGLCLWSGFSMSGFSSIGSFGRTGSGIVPYWSYGNGAALRGVALCLSPGKWSVSTLLNLSGLMQRGKITAQEALYVDVRRRTRHGTYALTAGVFPLENEGTQGQMGKISRFGGRISLSAHRSFQGWNVFGESCLEICTHKPSPALVCGLNTTLFDQWEMAASLRYYAPSFTGDRSGAQRAGSSCKNELGGALGVQYKGFFCSADACLHPQSREPSLRRTGQFKAVVSYERALGEKWELQARGQVRLRNYDEKQKYDFRVDGQYQSSVFRASAGLSLCHCEKWGVLGHTEQALVYPWGAFYLKECLFSASQWADRLYLYSREAPGNFSVPAYYGKGWSLSLYANGRIGRHWKLYLKGDMRSFLYKATRKFNYSLSVQLGMDF